MESLNQVGSALKTITPKGEKNNIPPITKAKESEAVRNLPPPQAEGSTRDHSREHNLGSPPRGPIR